MSDYCVCLAANQFFNPQQHHTSSSSSEHEIKMNEDTCATFICKSWSLICYHLLSQLTNASGDTIRWWCEDVKIGKPFRSDNDNSVTWISVFLLSLWFHDSYAPDLLCLGIVHADMLSCILTRVDRCSLHRVIQPVKVMPDTRTVSSAGYVPCPLPMSLMHKGWMYLALVTQSSLHWGLQHLICITSAPHICSLSLILNLSRIWSCFYH